VKCLGRGIKTRNLKQEAFAFVWFETEAGHVIVIICVVVLASNNATAVASSSVRLAAVAMGAVGRPLGLDLSHEFQVLRHVLEQFVDYAQPVSAVVRAQDGVLIVRNTRCSPC